LVESAKYAVSAKFGESVKMADDDSVKMCCISKKLSGQQKWLKLVILLSVIESLCVWLPVSRVSQNKLWMDIRNACGSDSTSFI